LLDYVGGRQKAIWENLRSFHPQLSEIFAIALKLRFKNYTKSLRYGLKKTYKVSGQKPHLMVCE